MTTTIEPTDLRSNHDARYDILKEAVGRGVERSRRELTPLEKHAVESFVTIFSDYVSEAVTSTSAESWIEDTTEHLIKEFPTLSLYLAASDLEDTMLLHPPVRYGFVGQALEKLVEQLSRTVEDAEPDLYKRMTS